MCKLLTKRTRQKGPGQRSRVGEENKTRGKENLEENVSVKGKLRGGLEGGGGQ